MFGLCCCCKQPAAEMLSAVTRVDGKLVACALCSRCRFGHWRVDGSYYGVPVYVPVLLRASAGAVCPLLAIEP